jgi:hypothetical protein
MSNFDWSSLDRLYLTKLLWEISNSIVGKSLLTSDLHSLMASHLKSKLPVRISKLLNDKVALDYVYVGGLYHSGYDENCKKCIEITFSYNMFQESLKLSKQKFKRICLLVADTILHEIIHMRQYRRRDFKYLPDYPSTASKQEQREEQSYLGCSDEIDAYGFNIACELTDKFGADKNQIVNYLNDAQYGNGRRGNSWRMYLKAFNYNHDHIIIKRLKKKVIRYLPYANIGKPYRNKDWISY